MKMKCVCAAWLLMQLAACVTLVVSDKVNFDFKAIKVLTSKQELEDFIDSPQLRVVYYYKMDLYRIKFFFKELDKSAEYLELYGVKVAVVDCLVEGKSDVSQCSGDNVGENVHTYRYRRLKDERSHEQLFDTHSIVSNVLIGNPLLALELDTMFDVNSIMSNVLQLVLLRQVPIVQTPKEVTHMIQTLKGRYDIIFGHMKAIGTFDHRVFMEVAYAYQEKFKFALCTDEQAISAFTELPAEGAESNIYIILTKDTAEQDEEFHSIKYTKELTLPAFAKFLMMLSLPKMFLIPQEGTENIYANVDTPCVRIYYKTADRNAVMDKASLIVSYYWGYVGLLLIDVEEVDSKELYPYEGELPAISMKQSLEDKEVFMKSEFDTENIAQFLEGMLQSEESKMTEEERKKDYTPSPPPDIEVETDREGLYIDHEAIEKQDDEVEMAIVKGCKKKKMLSIPALTDVTFPTTIQGSSMSAVTFYTPFDALNKAFVCKFGQAVDRLGESTTLNLKRVNCFDWTDVCADQNITIYPTLRLFSKGQKLWDYRGPKDAQEIYSTLRILELSPPVYLADPVAVMEYLVGSMASDVKSFSNVTVVGLFNKEHKQDMEAFANVAKETREKILFVFSDVEGTKQIASQFKTKVPAVILSRCDDSIQPHVVYTGPFQKDSLQTFVQENKLPRLTTITPLVFPELNKRGQDFLILFTDGSPDCKEQEDVMRDVLKTGLYNNISFTLMPVPDEESVGYKVLSQYTPEPSVPYISYVSLKMGEVYNFEAKVFQKRHLIEWISSVIKRTIQPSTVLKNNEWKPLQKGYDFLKIMDWEKAEEKKKRLKNKGDNARADIKTEIEERVASAHAADDLDEETRQELLELHSSRLYQKSSDKVHRQAGGKAGTSQKQEAVKEKQEPAKEKQEPAKESEKPTHDHIEL